MLAVSEDGKLVVAGSDSHGTAYGILEISRLLGVSLGMVGRCDSGEERDISSFGQV